MTYRERLLPEQFDLIQIQLRIAAVLDPELGAVIGNRTHKGDIKCLPLISRREIQPGYDDRGELHMIIRVENIEHANVIVIAGNIVDGQVEPSNIIADRRTHIRPVAHIAGQRRKIGCAPPIIRSEQ